MIKKLVCTSCTFVLITTVVADQREIHLTTGIDYAPYVSDQLPGGGLITRLVTEVAANAGYQASVDFLPWNRGYVETLRGRYVGTFPYFKTPEREQDFVFSDPIYVVQQQIFSVAGSNIRLNDRASLAGKTICLPLGNVLSSPIMAMIESKLIVRTSPPDFINCARMVFAGRADFYITDQIQGRETIASLKIGSKVVETGPPIGSENLYLMVNKTDPNAQPFLVNFNQALKGMKAKKPTR